MTTQPPAGFVDATAYLVLEGARTSWMRPNPETGLKPVDSVRVAAYRAGRPAKLARDQVAVKVTVRVPVEVFDPISPAALVVVPSNLVDRRPIEIDAVDAGDGAS